MSKEEFRNYLSEVLNEMEKTKYDNIERMESVNESIINTKSKINSFDVDKAIISKHEKDKYCYFKSTYNMLNFFAFLSFALIVAIRFDALGSGLWEFAKNIGLLLAAHVSVPLIGGTIAQLRYEKFIKSIDVNPEKLAGYKNNLDQLKNNMTNYQSIDKKIIETEAVIREYLNLLQKDDELHIEECLKKVNTVVEESGIKLTKQLDN